MSHNREPAFVVFSDDWGRHPSSCQHLFRRISATHRVLWVNTIGLRAAKADKFTFHRALEKLREWSMPLRQAKDNLWVLAPVMLPVSGEGAAGRANRWWTAGSVGRTLRRLGMKRPVLFASVPTAIDYVGRLGESAVVYYITDDYSLWPGGNADRIRAADSRLARAADLVLPCSQALADSHADVPGRVRILRHGVDRDHFVTPRQEPGDLKALPHPRACFFGLIYEKIDLPLIEQLARQMPGLHIVMIGPVQTDVSSLGALGNVHFLGPRAYEDLPAYLQACDMVIVPYVPDDVIRASGPLKIRECLALGKLTVVREIPDLRQFGDVLRLYNQPQQFVPMVRQALSEPVDPALAGRMRQRIAADTWEARVATVMEQIECVLAGRKASR